MPAPDSSELVASPATDAGADQTSPCLALVATVLADLAAQRIRYCHWKSNYHLEYAVSSREDLDVLVAKEHFPAFVRTLLSHGFKLGETLTSRQQPGVYHLMGYDPASSRLINVHAYTRIVTGDHLLKCCTWPLERFLFDESQERYGIPVPSRSAELIVFVFRTLTKHTTLLDHYFMSRGVDPREELAWLLEGADLEHSRALMAEHFPEVRPRDFERALELLPARGLGAHLARVRLGLRIRRALGAYERYGLLKRGWTTLTAAPRMAWSKLVRRERHIAPTDGGLLIAFVGPQATGKSTLINHAHEWLGQELSVSRHHVGKPPATLLTMVPRWLIPLARSLFPGKATGEVERDLQDDTDKSPPLIFVARKLMLAYDRRVLLRRLYRASRAGRIVLCDRYPADNAGAIDGRSFSPERIAAEPSGLKRFLMRLEDRQYDRIAPADAVFTLSVNVETAVQRNEERDKLEDQSEDYVRFRHATHGSTFKHSRVIPISTACALEESLATVRREIWSLI